MYRSFYTLRTGFNSAVRALKLVIDRHVSSKMHISKYIGFSTAGLLGTSMSLVYCNSEYIQTASGLKYINKKVGNGETPTVGQNVEVHYTGWLDGFDGEKKFDSSYDRGTPIKFPVGKGNVIAGWDEILLTDMKVGTIRDVIIPPHLGYGKRGAGRSIPPNATLYFRVELVAVGPKSIFSNKF